MVLSDFSKPTLRVYCFTNLKNKLKIIKYIKNQCLFYKNEKTSIPIKEWRVSKNGDDLLSHK